MNINELFINESKCIHCGQCEKDCILNCLELNMETKVPQFKEGKETSCIKCQHCMAVCPVGALSILNKSPENSDTIGEFNPENLLNLIKSRRSVRAYKPENVDKERLTKLKTMLKWVPTGVNYHKLHFAFIDDIEVMDDFRNFANKKLINFLANPVVKKVFPKFAIFKDMIENGNDIVFRGAPHMVVVSAPVKAPCKNVDPIIALSYLELYANSLGLGTLWCGFGQYCFKLFPELSEYIEVPDGYKVVYTMLFGVPDIKYHRTTQPENFEITTVQKRDKTKKMPVEEQVKRFLTNNFG